MRKFWKVLFNRLRYKSAASYEHLITVKINREHLLSNLRDYQQKFPRLQIAPVLKSNAYGHGLLAVAEILRGEPAPFWIIDTYFEALALRRAGFNKPLLIIGFTPVKTICHNRLHELAFTITSEAQLLEIATDDPRAKIHLKFNTGMNRQGLPLVSTEKIIEALKKTKHLELVGLCSHLACADEPNHPQNDKQITAWNNLVDIFKNNFPQIKYFHLAATYGATLTDKIHSNVLRLGLGLYGLEENNKNQKPVLTLSTIISDIKTIPVGEAIGYDADFETTRITKIAILPVGYYEAMPRILSNQAVVKIGDIFCPLLGKISMNIMVVDVTTLPNIKIGETVTIISDCSNDPNSANHLAQLAQTIPYEIICKIPLNIKRLIV